MKHLIQKRVTATDEVDGDLTSATLLRTVDVNKGRGELTYTVTNSAEK